MNIFVIDDHPVTAAQQLPDKLVIKLIIENTQMLSVWAKQKLNKRIIKPDGSLYGCTAYSKHPCTLWVCNNNSNAAWLIINSLAMCAEYTNRYGKTHATEQAIDQLSNIFKEDVGSLDCYKDHTEFVICAPDVYKGYDPITAYRLYLNTEKGYAVWNKKPERKPSWWNNELHQPARDKYLNKKND